jgi:hypothetical protein
MEFPFMCSTSVSVRTAALLLLLASTIRPVSAAINSAILPLSSYPTAGDVLLFDPNNPATADTTERTVHTTRLLVQTFQVANTFELQQMYLLYARGNPGTTALVRIFPVANTLAPSIQADFDAALANGFVLNQTFVMPNDSNPAETRATLKLDMTGADQVTISATTGTAGYGLMITSPDQLAAPGVFTWRGGDTAGGGFYAGGRQYYDDLSTGGASRTNRDFVLAMIGEGLIPGDTDGDGIGGEFPEDFNPIRDNFQKAVALRSEGDLVPNGKVNFADFRQWKSAFEAGGGAVADIDLNFLAVPEPSSIILVVLGTLSAAGRMRRRR